MRRLAALFFVALFVFGCGQKPPQNLVPPQAEKIPVELTKHGDTRIDNYFWLNQRDNPQVLDHLKAENEYTRKMMKHTEKLQKKLYEEMVGRLEQDDNTVPYLKNGYYYYTRYEEGKEYPIYCRKKGSLEAEEEILLDVNGMAAGFAYYHVTGLEISPDNNLLAFGVDTLSRRRYTLNIKDLKTGRLLDKTVPNTEGDYAWANDNATLFYTTKDSTLRPDKVWRHKLDQDAENDKLIFHEKDNTFNVGIYKSKNDRYVYIESSQTLSTEVRFLDADRPDGEFRIFHPRERDVEYHVDDRGDRFYVLTNYRAKNFRLMTCGRNATGKSAWIEVIPNREDVLLTDVTLFNNYLVLSERKEGLPQLRIINEKTGEEHYLDFGEEAYVARATANFEMDTDLLRYSYSSLTTPMSTYDYNMETREKTLLKRDRVLGGYDPANYETKRLWAPARDGVMVPITIVYRKDFEKDGTHPLLLYGYGSYGFSRDPYFSSSIISLLDRGFAYAIAHIRGGQELGRYWYEEGKLLKKKNTFFDFIDCAEYLLKEKYTSKEKMFAMGGSAGGLLIGAVVNYRPDLFRAVIAAVPWVDVVTTMLDESIPLTTAEYDEWGNPNIKEYYDYMLSYSPYDNVKAQDYPAMLVTTGLHDSQVQYFEPVKWVAKLRELKTDDDPILLDIDMDTGHGGASGRFKRYKRIALEYAFLLDQLGMKK